jgi:hypothetical protein
MKTKKVSLSTIKVNPNNPRLIKDDKFKKLVQSVKDFPQMLEIRPIVVNSDMVILGGNMRFKACQEAGIKELPIIIADNLTEEQQREFLIKDNISGGEWDWDILANEWDTEELNAWGLEVWETTPEADYSLLDDDDVSKQLEDMTSGVKKAIQIEFESEHYEEAYQLVKFFREREYYVGGMIMQFLKAEKEKL